MSSNVLRCVTSGSPKFSFYLQVFRHTYKCTSIHMLRCLLSFSDFSSTLMQSKFRIFAAERGADKILGVHRTPAGMSHAALFLPDCMAKSATTNRSIKRLRKGEMINLAHCLTIAR